MPIPPPAAPTAPIQYPDFKTVQKAAQGGNAHAQFQLGALYADGKGGVSQDYAKALQWFKKAADQGHAAGQFSLARMHVEGLGGAPRDINKATQLFLQAADQGHADAQFVAGIIYADQNNHALAKQWFQKAAAQGQTQAQAILSTGF
jgi:TPR repeat protein